MGAPLSVEWDVARHCTSRDVDEEANATYPRANGSAFELRPGETYLSVNCPNIFGDLPDLKARLKRILSDLRTKPDPRKVRSSHWFAILSVDAIVKIQCSSTAQNLRVELEAEPGDTSHSGIYGQSGATEEEELMALQTQIAACFSGPAVRVRDLEGGGG